MIHSWSILWQLNRLDARNIDKIKEWIQRKMKVYSFAKDGAATTSFFWSTSAGGIPFIPAATLAPFSTFRLQYILPLGYAQELIFLTKYGTSQYISFVIFWFCHALNIPCKNSSSVAWFHRVPDHFRVTCIVHHDASGLWGFISFISHCRNNWVLYNAYYDWTCIMIIKVQNNLFNKGNINKIDQ